MAFGLLLAETLLGEAPTFEQAGAPLALVIAPTRELAVQVQRELSWLLGDAAGRVVSTVGGMDPRREARALAAGAHVVVGTPGRLRDHIERKNLDLSAVRALVLDEGDEMLDMGFREELEAILGAAPGERRTVLFSATLPRPILELAKRYTQDAARVAATPTGRGPRRHRAPRPRGGAAGAGARARERAARAGSGAGRWSSAPRARGPTTWPPASPSAASRRWASPAI